MESEISSLSKSNCKGKPSRKDTTKERTAKKDTCNNDTLLGTIKCYFLFILTMRRAYLYLYVKRRAVNLLVPWQDDVALNYRLKQQSNGNTLSMIFAERIFCCKVVENWNRTNNWVFCKHRRKENWRKCAYNYTISI